MNGQKLGTCFDRLGYVKHRTEKGGSRVPEFALRIFKCQLCGNFCAQFETLGPTFVVTESAEQGQCQERAESCRHRLGAHHRARELVVGEAAGKRGRPAVLWGAAASSVM